MLRMLCGIWSPSLLCDGLFLHFIEKGDGIGSANGWSTWYSGAGYINASAGIDPGSIGNGTSFHITSYPGAQMLLTFRGFSVTLYGAASGVFTVSLDGQVQNGTSGNDFDNMLFTANGLDFGDHVVTLISESFSQQLSFNYALINSTDENGT